MLVYKQEHVQLVCDVCSYPVPLAKGEIIASAPSSAGHYPQALVVCSETCRLMAESQMDVQPIRRVGLRQALEVLLRE